MARMDQGWMGACAGRLGRAYWKPPPPGSSGRFDGHLAVVCDGSAEGAGRGPRLEPYM